MIFSSFLIYDTVESERIRLDLIVASSSGAVFWFETQ